MSLPNQPPRTRPHFSSMGDGAGSLPVKSRDINPQAALQSHQPHKQVRLTRSEAMITM